MPQGDVEEEADLEYCEADQVGSLILQQWGLSRAKAISEVLQFDGCWKSPGEAVDLSFLAADIAV